MASGVDKPPRTGAGSAAAWQARRHPARPAEGGSPEMHRQMCKKIAQLTKVIYALNTRNDEQEDSLQALKDTHQEEIQRMVAETRKMVLQHESKVEEARELQRHIQALEAALEKQRKKKEDILSEFSMCRKEHRGEDLQPQARQNCEKRFLLMKTGLSEQDTRKGVQAGKEEQAGFASKLSAFAGDRLSTREKSTEMHSADVQDVARKTASVAWEKKERAEEYAKQRSQLCTPRVGEEAQQESVADACREAEQREDKGIQEGASPQQVGKLEAHLEAKGQEINELKKYSQELKEKMQDLESQLKETQRMTTESKSISKILEEELIIAKEKLLLQEKESMPKRETMQVPPSSRSRGRTHVDGPKDRSFHSQRTSPFRLSQGSEDSQDPFLRPNEISKPPKEKAKSREPSVAVLSTRNGEKQRLDHRSPPKKEDRHSPAGLQKEKTRALQEEWYYQKTELQAQVTQLKHALEQQEKTFRETFKQQDLQARKEKEKVFQDLQDTIKQSQDSKAQLEASHQRAIHLLKEEFKEVKESWKKEQDEKFKVQQQTHILEMQALEEKAVRALQSELDRMQKQQTLLIESLRKELSEQQATSVNHSKVKADLEVELKTLMGLQKEQEKSYQDQIQSLKDELAKCQKEVSELKKENSHLKGTVDLLSSDVEQQKPVSSERENQPKRCEEVEEKLRKRVSRLEDLHLISRLQDKLNEKEEVIKELMDGRGFQHPLLPSRDPCHNPLFSFSTRPATCLTPVAKKKKMDEASSRLVTVPNLASYAKSFLSGELRPKRNQPQNTKMTGLDQNLGCVKVCCPSLQALENKPPSSLESNETSKPKDTQKPDSRHQEWFTKYFSF